MKRRLELYVCKGHRIQRESFDLPDILENDYNKIDFDYQDPLDDGNRIRIWETVSLSDEETNEIAKKRGDELHLL